MLIARVIKLNPDMISNRFIEALDKQGDQKDRTMVCDLLSAKSDPLRLKIQEVDYAGKSVHFELKGQEKKISFKRIQNIFGKQRRMQR